MITFHKLTLAQYEKVVQKGNTVVDGLYFLTDVGVIKLHNGEGSVTTFGVNIKIVSEFPDSSEAQRYCVYSNETTKEQRMWDGTEWQILNYPVINQITSGLAEDSAPTTVPNTAAVYNYVNDQISAVSSNSNSKLLIPVQTTEQLQNLSLTDVQNNCMILVSEVGLYRYDASSTVENDPNSNAVIVPKEVSDNVQEGESITQYSGRWVKMFNDYSYVAGNGVSISTSIGNEQEKVISLDVNEEHFTFIDGKLNINPALDFVTQKVDKVSGYEGQIPVWREDGNQNASGYKFNTTSGMTNSDTTISPDSIISSFVQEIADGKLDTVSLNSDKKIIIGKENDGQVDASKYVIGTDFDNLTPGLITDVPKNTVATERAVKWYIDKSLSFNPDYIPTSLSSIINYDD